MNTMKRIVAVILLMTTLVLALASCNSGDDGIKNNGLLEDSAIDKSCYYTFNRTSGANRTLDTLGARGYDIVKNELAEGQKVASFDFRFKRKVVDKTVTKVKFTIEADRDTTVCFATSRAGISGEFQNSMKTVSLMAGIAKEITFEPNYFVDIKYPTFMISIYPNDARNYSSLSDEKLLEWNQTVYKITNIELYAE